MSRVAPHVRDFTNPLTVCTHGIPYGPKQRCIDCEIVWEREGLASCEARERIHRDRLAELLSEKQKDLRNRDAKRD
jgi:hypothetical protein